MKRRWITALILAAILAGGTAHPVLAGWMIQEADPEFPGEVTTYWFQGGKARVHGALEGLTMILDPRADRGYLLDPVARRYAGGTITEIADQLAKLEIEGMPGGAEGAGVKGAAAEDPLKTGTVTVKDLGAGGRFLGYESRRYEVRVDGDLLEELFVAPKVDVEREIDLAAFAAAMRRMLGSSAGQSYEDNAAYRAIFKNGYPVQQILYFVGEKSILQTKKCEVKRFPDADFTVPPGYTKVGYLELLIGRKE